MKETFSANNVTVVNSGKLSTINIIKLTYRHAFPDQKVMVSDKVLVH